MLRRLAGRLLTGPMAFFLAGAIDLATFGLAALRASIRRRVSGR